MSFTSNNPARFVEVYDEFVLAHQEKPFAEAMDLLFRAQYESLMAEFQSGSIADTTAIQQLRDIRFEIHLTRSQLAPFLQNLDRLAQLVFVKLVYEHQMLSPVRLALYAEQAAATLRRFMGHSQWTNDAVLQKKTYDELVCLAISYSNQPQTLVDPVWNLFGLQAD